MFSQETYVSKENAVSATGFGGRYDADNRWGFGFSYSLKGVLQFSYTRSSILTKEKIDNHQDEYFFRFYAPQQKWFIFSVGVGYLYQEARRDLWTNYPLDITTKGVGIEGGLHLVAEDKITRRVVVSLIYTYLEPTLELQTPEMHTIDSDLARSLSFDIALIYYFGQVGLVIGPRMALDSDFQNVFVGLHTAILFKH